MSNVKENADNLKNIIDKSLKLTENDANSKQNDQRIGVLVMACNRPTVSLHLDQLLKFVSFKKDANYWSNLVFALKIKRIQRGQVSHCS